MNLTVSKSKCILPLFLLFSVCFMAFFCYQKKAFFMDEGFSYSQSNHIRPFIPGLVAQQFCRNDPVFTTYLTVQPEQRFHYEYLQNNLMAHPPLYYVIIHTISSFFPDVFSKWFGLGLNLLLFLITQLLLYGLSKQFLTEKKAFLPLIFYGFSIPAICCVTYIRNYMLFTTELTGLFLLAVCMAQSARDDKQQLFYTYLFGYAAVLFLGCMTHYYFYIVAFFLCAGLCLLLLIYKRYLFFLYFTGVCLTVVGICPIIFPQMLSHIFGYEQSIPRSVIPAIKQNSSDFINYFSVWNNMINADFLGGLLHHTQYISYFLIVFLIGIFIYICFKYRKLNAELFMLCSVVVASIVVISLIDPMRMKRYYFPLMPVLSLMAVLGINFIMTAKWRDTLGGIVTQYIAVVLLLVFNLQSPDFDVYLLTKNDAYGRFADSLKNKILFIKWLDGGQSRWEMIIPGLYSFSAHNFIIFNEFSDDCYQKMMQHKDRSNVVLMTAYNGKCDSIEGWKPLIDDGKMMVCAYEPQDEENSQINTESTE